MFFTVRTLNQYQRAKRDAENLEYRAKYVEVVTAKNALVDMIVPKAVSDRDERAKILEEKITPEQNARLNALYDQEVALYNAHIVPALIRCALVQIEGLIDGEGKQVLAVDHFLECAPDELLKEVCELCEKASGLTGEQQKN